MANPELTNRINDVQQSGLRVEYSKSDPSLQLWQANNAVQRAYRQALKPYQLTYVQFVVLRTLELDMNHMVGRQRWLARRLQANKVMLGQVLRKLEENDYVRQQRSWSNRKTHSWCVTDKGRVMVPKIMDALAGLDAEVNQVLLQKPNLLVGLHSLEPPVRII